MNSKIKVIGVFFVACFVGGIQLCAMEWSEANRSGQAIGNESKEESSTPEIVYWVYPDNEIITTKNNLPDSVKRMGKSNIFMSFPDTNVRRFVNSESVPQRYSEFQWDQMRRNKK